MTRIGETGSESGGTAMCGELLPFSWRSQMMPGAHKPRPIIDGPTTLARVRVRNLTR